MIKLAISGCCGRMGARIAELAQQDSEFKILAALEIPNHPKLNTPLGGVKITSNTAAIKGSDVLIEFTSPEATMMHLDECVKTETKMIIGTTGLSADQIKKIKLASKKIPIVFSSNMSVGVNLLFKLVGELAARTAGKYKVKIVEAHHVHKKDAPSGTAKTIAQAIERASKYPVEDIQSIREGEIIGNHDVTFESDVDIITIGHHAKTRDILVQGALVAAKFIAKKKTGLFSMQDVLGLK
ncbi:MAG: 4-hydroxy-tetrahydrodipicolinate reductase [Candidatus Omnitrophota bacterium]